MPRTQGPCCPVCAPQVHDEIGIGHADCLAVEEEIDSAWLAYQAAVSRRSSRRWDRTRLLGKPVLRPRRCPVEAG